MNDGQVKGVGRSHPPQGKNYILGIGINRYQHWTPLNNAVKDLNDIIHLLQTKYQFEATDTKVLLDEDATRENIYEALESYGEKLTEKDNLLIYFSGHGHQHARTRKGFWIPVEARRGHILDYLSNNFILDQLETFAAKHILLIADACFSGSLLRGGKMRSDYALNQLEQRRSRWAMCSGRHDKLVYDGRPGENSPFASSILKVLSENQYPRLNVMKLIEPVKMLTSELCDQVPIARPILKLGDDGGEFIFKRRYDEEKIWHTIKDQNDIRLVENFIQKFPYGKYSSEARLLLSNLQEEARRILIKLEEEKLWQIIIRKNTIEAYYKYIDTYPHGKYNENALRKINDLRDDLAFQESKAEGSIPLLLKYVKDFPKGKYVKQAKKLLELLSHSTREKDMLPPEKKMIDTIDSFSPVFFQNSKKDNNKVVKKKKENQSIKFNTKKKTDLSLRFSFVIMFVTILFMSYLIYLFPPVFNMNFSDNQKAFKGGDESEVKDSSSHEVLDDRSLRNKKLKKKKIDSKIMKEKSLINEDKDSYHKTDSVKIDHSPHISTDNAINNTAKYTISKRSTLIQDSNYFTEFYIQEEPSDFKNSCAVKIESIHLRIDITEVILHMIDCGKVNLYPPGASNAFFIKAEGKEYLLKGVSENIRTGINIDVGSEKKISLFFEALPQDIKELDMLEGKDKTTEGSHDIWHFKGIKLLKNKNHEKNN